jgi:ABC-type phosphate transport system auxiliary subunit
MGGMTQTLTGAAMTENYEEPKKSLESQLDSDMDSRWSEPATRGDLRNAVIRIDTKFDSLRTYIDTRFLGLQQQFGKAGRLHQIEFVMIMLGFIGIILNLR